MTTGQRAVESAEEFAERYFSDPYPALADMIEQRDAAIRAAERAPLEARIAELEEQHAEEEASFQLRWDADMRAIKQWQAATGRESTWPNHSDLCVWLLERLDEKEGQIVDAAVDGLSELANAGRALIERDAAEARARRARDDALEEAAQAVERIGPRVSGDAIRALATHRTATGENP